MITLRFCWLLFSLICMTTALVPPVVLYPSAFNCSGGSIYFNAHPADGLLYQNPDLLHDLYVLKCVTTVVFTSGDRGFPRNHSLSLEHGLEAAHAWMRDARKDDRDWQATNSQIGKFKVRIHSHKELPSMQIVYLGLPDGGPGGQGYVTNTVESLKKLYTGDIKSITTTDGSATYTLESLKGLIAAILLDRKATKIGVLDYKAAISDGDNRSNHADHVVSAKIVVDVMKRKHIRTKLVGYADGFARKLDASMNSSQIDFRRKADAFFKYAAYDQHMCQSYNECFNGTAGPIYQPFPNEDVDSVARSLEREYYVF